MPADHRDDPGIAAGQDMDRAARLALLVQQIAAVGSDHPSDPTEGRSRTSGSAAGRSGRARSRAADPATTEQGPTDSEQEAAAKAICLRLLTIAPRPRSRLEQALRRKEIPDDVAERVLDRLTEVGLIDDAAYAQAYVRTKHRDRGLGRSALGHELRRLGIDKAAVTDAVDQVDGDDERERATQLVAKRIGPAMAAGPDAARRRLMAFLARRGYSPDLTISVVEQAVDSYRSA
ncbi:hypothetical protein GIS00_21695 [Nakamurella sp. YIM 132087]|uniref:Regulatory protein RecX n=1 Tax=Nakamurella alba TaxID=2665158 RepID=A0A7K1FQY2_9ACTN|nr:regulatory protein RecX [Nakamurella alba]MTD16555.1 hypothetical protein [Nakamurella alba]